MSLGMTRPRVVGSGKFGTPCERMHSANLSSGPLLVGVPFDPRDDPQAVTATKHPAAISGINVLLRWLFNA